MRRFRGIRPHPPTQYAESGLTNGPGAIDYQGVIFDDGSVALRWCTQFRSTSLWADFETFYHVHGHPEYGTVIEFLDEASTEREIVPWLDGFARGPEGR